MKKLFLVVAAFLVGVLPGIASTYTWGGGDAGSNNWSTADNWTTNISPSNDGSASVVFTGTTRLSPLVDQNWSVNGLTFAPSAGAFSIGGDQLTIGSAGINNASYSNQAISNSLVLSSTEDWNAGAESLNITGAINNNGYTLTLDGNNLAISSTLSNTISGSGGLTKQGYGEWTLTGNNSYTGSTTVLAGVLLLSNTSTVKISNGSNGYVDYVYSGGGNTINGNLTIGDNINSAGTAIVRFASITTSNEVYNGTGNNYYAYGCANQIPVTSNVTVNSSGILDLNAGSSTEYYNGSSDFYLYNDQTLNGLTVNGGSVVNIHSLVLTGSLGMTAGSIGAASSSDPGLTLGVGNGITTNACPNSAVISAPLNLNGSAQPFNIAQGTGSTDLQISGVVSNGAIVKTGSGSLLLSAANTFTGGITFNGGTLIVGNNSALGIGTVVMNSGSLLAQNSNSYTLSNAITTGTNVTFGSTGSGTLTLDGAVTLTGNDQFNMNSGTTVFAGPILDGGHGYGVTVSGTGTMQLSGVETFLGTMTVTSGLVRIANANALAATGGVTVSAGGAFDLYGQNVVSFPLSLSGTGSSVATGALLNGSSTAASFGGPITFSGSTLIQANSGAITLNGGITGAGTLTIAGNYNTILAGSVGTSGTLSKSGSGVLFLGGSNSVGGAIVINAGTVQLGNAAALGTGGEVTSVLGGTLDLNGQNVGAQPVTLAGGVSLINSSSTTASLGGAVTLTGAATINAQGGNLYLPGGENGSSYILTITGAGNTYATGPLNLGTGGITKSGNGVLVLSASNSYTGATTVSAGTVQLSGQGSLPAASSVSISSGATFDLNNNSTTLGSLSGAGNVLIESSTLSIGANNVGTTFSGAITGTGSLAKIGTGTLTLSGSNAFSGVAVSAGILSLASANALGSPGTNVTVSQGGTLDLGGQTMNGNALVLNGTGTASEPGALYNSSGNTASVPGPITIASPATIYAGAGPIALSGTITGNTTLTFSGGGNTTVSGILSLGTGGLTKLGTGTLYLSPSQAPSYGGPTTINAGTIQLTSTAGPAIPGNLTIGDGSGSYSASVLFNGNSQLSGASTVTVNQACSLNLNGFSNTVASVSVAGGSILANGGVLTTGTLTTAGANLSSASGLIQVTGAMVNNSITATTTVTTPTTVQGSIVNNGGLAVSGTLTSSGGVTNNTTLSVTTTGVIVGNGTGLDNEGSLFLNGGTIKGTGTVLNDGVVSGYGVLNGSGGITNYSQITQSGGTLTLSNSGTNLNYGTATLTSGYQFRLTGGNLTNFGTVNLDSGVMAGSASFVNSYGGTISGPGTILTPFSNTGGSMILGYGSTVVEQNFTNTGIVNLESYEASLTGGALNNVGTIQGQGNVGNSITNTGIIEAIGGTLTLSGTVQNWANGLITAATGDKVLMVAGMATNQGVINLTGGTFDNNGFALANTNQISGYGAFRTGSLSNTGTMTFSGGESTIDGNVTNQSKGVVSVNDYPTLFTGSVTNYGVFTSSSASATFAGAFVNDGVYSSDPSSNTFSNLMVGPMGYITAGTGDTFSISGSFTNESSQAGDWNTVGADLLFETGSSHTMMVSGSNEGSSRSGFQSNFAWNTLELGVGQSLTLESGSSGSSALYVSALVLDGGLSEISSIAGNGVDIYYDPSNSSNSYLSGNTFALADGGEIAQVSPVPEPGSAGLIVVAILGAALGVAQRKYAHSSRIPVLPRSLLFVHQ